MIYYFILILIVALSKVDAIEQNVVSNNVEELVRIFVSEVARDVEFVLVRDEETSRSTPHLTQLIKNTSQSCILTWTDQKIPLMPKGHIEYKFSWLDRPWRVRQANKLLLLMIVTKDNFEDAITYAASMISFEPSHHKVIFWFPDATQEETDELLLHEKSSFFKYKIGIVVNNENIITIRSVCFFCNNGEPLPYTAKIYEGKIGSIVEDEVFSDTTMDLHGKMLRGTFFFPFDRASVKFRQERVLPVNYMEAYVTDIMQYMNAQYFVNLYDMPPNVTVDVELEDGSWYGQLGEVLYDRATFGVVTSVNGPAMKIVEWPHVYTFPIMRYLTRKPRPRFGWYAIGQPFTPDMWIAILISCCFGIAVFRCFLWVQSHFLNPFHPRKPPSMAWGYCLSYIFLPLMEENPPKVPTSHTARTFVAFWWAYATIITCCYDTKLIGFLAAPELEHIPQSFPEMLKYPKWSYAMQAGVGVYFGVFIQESEHQHHHKVHEQLQFTVDINECFDRALTRDSACIDLDVYLIPFSMFYVDKYGTYPFKVAENEDSFNLHGSLSVQRHSVIAPTMRKLSLQLQVSGLLDYYHKEFPFTCKLVGLRLSRKLNRYYESKMELVVEQLKGPLMLMVVFGWIIPLFVFLYEVGKEKCLTGNGIVK